MEAAGQPRQRRSQRVVYGLGALAAAHGKEYGLFAGKAGKVQPSLPVAAVKLGPYGGAGMDALCADVF